MQIGVMDGAFSLPTRQELLKAPDLILCGFPCSGGEVDLEAEIAGESDVLARTAALSALCPSVVLAGVKTHISGLRHLSAAVSVRGKLLDIVDRTQNIRGDEYLPGSKIKIYRTGKANVALLLDTDMLLAKNWERVSPLCDMILCLSLPLSDEEAGVAATLSQLYGLPYVLVADNGLWWGEPNLDA